MSSARYIIFDNTGVIWSDESPNAAQVGDAILEAVDSGDLAGYEKFIGREWVGDLVFVKEIGRTR
jgi:hypothetical protein